MTRSALIVAHGQPSDPAPAEEEMHAIAEAVAQHLPGWTVAAATLAAPDALRSALDRLDSPLVFPFFMADGWFIRSLLPKRLEEAGHSGLTVLTPFGLLPATHRLALGIVRQATETAGWDAAGTTVILAAHGSGRSRFPAEAARSIERAIVAGADFAGVRTGFIEEPPDLATVAADAGRRAICLPLFVARWGHVVDDIPRELAAARFSGTLLSPIGTHPQAPKIIAEAILSEAGEANRT